MPLPEGRHDDWPLFFKYVPRSWNAIASDVPPVRIAGTEREEDHLDVPERGRWALAGFKRWKVPVYFAVTTKSGVHFRIGLLRFDYVDGYCTWPTFTVKRLS